MSLQRKFIVLLALLGLTVLGGLSATIWTFIAQHRALAGPFKDAPKFLDNIDSIQHQLAGIHLSLDARDHTDAFFASLPPDRRQSLNPAPDPASIPIIAQQEFDRRLSIIVRELERMSASDLYISAGPENAITTMAQRITLARSLAPLWFRDADNDARSQIKLIADKIAARSSEIRLRVLEDRSRGIDFSNAIVGKLVTVLFSSAVASLLFGILALVLLQRWVLRPIRNLRTAAAQIAQGRFDHQIPVRGTDEIAQLSLEVNHMAGTIRTMLDERVERERLAALGEMVRRLAHSLRNPLAGIRGLAEITRDELPLTSDLREHQTRILKAVDRFEHWLSDLLNSTRPLQIQLAPINTLDFIAHVIDSHRALAHAKNISLVLVSQAVPTTVICDAPQLEHALVSVLTNAIQASPIGGQVVFTVLASSDTWEVRIADQGPGIPPSLHDKIFLPYFTTKPNGTGIGLAITKQVIQSHGGSIRVLSNPTTNTPQSVSPLLGTTFIIRIPLNPALVPLDHPTSITPPGGPGVSRAQDTDHRGRGESPVLHPQNPGQVRPLRL